VVIDVREPEEIEIARLPDALHVPMSALDGALGALDPYVEYVVVCHHGIRSAHAAARMIERGFTRVANLLGGVDAWACEIDPSMTRY